MFKVSVHVDSRRLYGPMTIQLAFLHVVHIYKYDLDMFQRRGLT